MSAAFPHPAPIQTSGARTAGLWIKSVKWSSVLSAQHPEKTRVHVKGTVWWNKKWAAPTPTSTNMTLVFAQVSWQLWSAGGNGKGRALDLNCETSRPSGAFRVVTSSDAKDDRAEEISPSSMEKSTLDGLMSGQFSAYWWLVVDRTVN